MCILNIYLWLQIIKVSYLHYYIMVYHHIQNNRFGTSPHFISFVSVINISLAISYFLVINSKPSKDISESLPQSKNQGYPAIIVCRLDFLLYTIKLSIAIKKSLVHFLFSNSSPCHFCNIFF